MASYQLFFGNPTPVIVGRTIDFSATETGPDSVAIDADVQIAASIVGSETGPDSFVVEANTITNANLFLTESGSDSSSANIDVINTSSLNVAETGVDSIAIDGNVQLEASLSGSETSPDTFVAEASTILNANLATTELGPDGAAFDVEFKIYTSVAAQETGDDNISMSLINERLNTSATGGCILPYNRIEPLEDEALENFIQEWVVCLTNLPANLVRPRWQPETVNIPEATITWASIGILRWDTDTFPAEVHYKDGAGYTELRTHQRLHILSSFYGPQGMKFASRLRDGMKVGQNREDLFVQNMDVIESSEIISIPEFIKEKWMRRYDLPFVLSRQIVRHYPILNLLSAEIDINNEYYTEITILGV